MDQQTGCWYVKCWQLYNQKAGPLNQVCHVTEESGSQQVNMPDNNPTMTFWEVMKTYVLERESELPDGRHVAHLTPVNVLGRQHALEHKHIQ